MSATIHFDCTRCGRCCSNLKVPLTAGEAVDWLTAGHPVQILCEATPWAREPAAQDLQALHCRRRSFAAQSGILPVRVVVILAANILGPCPNLLPNLMCGIYERRPLVCRIYPAEINPFVRLDTTAKLCPEEAWAGHHPLLMRDGRVMDASIRRNIETSRDTDAHEVPVKRRLCRALNCADAALAREGFAVYSPDVTELRNALLEAMAASDPMPGHEPWRIVSNQDATLSFMADSGAVAVRAGGVPAATVPRPYDYLGFKPGSPTA